MKKKLATLLFLTILNNVLAQINLDNGENGCKKCYNGYISENRACDNCENGYINFSVVCDICNGTPGGVKLKIATEVVMLKIVLTEEKRFIIRIVAPVKVMVGVFHVMDMVAFVEHVVIATVNARNVMDQGQAIMMLLLISVRVVFVPDLVIVNTLNTLMKIINAMEMDLILKRHKKIQI